MKIWVKPVRATTATLTVTPGRANSCPRPDEERHQPSDGGDRDVEQDHEHEQETEHPPARAPSQLP